MYLGALWGRLFAAQLVVPGVDSIPELGSRECCVHICTCAEVNGAHETATGKLECQKKVDVAAKMKVLAAMKTCCERYPPERLAKHSSVLLPRLGGPLDAHRREGTAALLGVSLLLSNG